MGRKGGIVSFIEAARKRLKDFSSRDQLKELYDLIKGFWLDVWKGFKQGAILHRRAIKTSLILCSIAFLALSLALLKFTESSTFCGLCHQMDAYLESWRASSHRHVACTQCHYEPGVLNHLKGKWVDGQVSLAYFLSGKRPSAPHAQISDASCLQKGCHKIEDLKGSVIYKNVTFSHEEHLGEVRRGMKLRCTSCHGQMVQGLHLTVHETNCIICHYYKAGPRGEEDCVSCAIGGCTTCHIEPKGDINVKGWNFNHRKYIQRGVACEKCHMSVVQGDGHVPEGKCLECHNEPEILVTKYSSPSLHRNHVTDHKIECSTCHTPLRHEIGEIPTIAHFPSNCDKCHSKDVHGGPREMYRGMGGIGVPDSPSLMFTANVDCIACHRRGEASQAALHTTRYEERAIGEACVDCHGEGFDETLKHWKRFLSKLEQETSQRLYRAESVLFEYERARGKTPDLRKALSLLNEARHNYSFVLLGKGVHNVEYAVKLLNVANNKTEGALAAINKNYRPREFRTQMDCTTLCHVGIEKRSVPFNEMKFSHASHVGGNGQRCPDCHSRRENHGKTFLKNCVDCHHGEGIKSVSCEGCHFEVKKLIDGRGGIGVKDRPSKKSGAVSCLDCHPGVTARKKDTFEDMVKRCIECHDPSYGEMAVQWRTKFGEVLKKVGEKLEKVRGEIDRIDRLGGHTFVYRKLFGEAGFNYDLAKKGNGIHNLEYSQGLLEFASRRLDEAMKQLSKGKEERLPLSKGLKK